MSILKSNLYDARFKLIVHHRDGHNHVQNIDSLPGLNRRIASINQAQCKGYEVLLVMHVCLFEDTERDKSSVQRPGFHGRY